jgi:hypothetical protein
VAEHDVGGVPVHVGNVSHVLEHVAEPPHVFTPVRQVG